MESYLKFIIIIIDPQIGHLIKYDNAVSSQVNRTRIYLKKTNKRC